MPNLKDTVWAIIVISLVSAVMMVGVAQLDSSGWAEGIRAEATAEIEATDSETGEGETVGEDGLEGFSPLLMIAVGTIGSLIKISLLLGVPGLLTIGVRRLIDRVRKRASVGTAPS